jgi:hypothetical protein
MTTDLNSTAKGAGEYADVNGLRMYYEIHGTGQPLILQSLVVYRGATDAAIPRRSRNACSDGSRPRKLRTRSIPGTLQEGSSTVARYRRPTWADRMPSAANALNRSSPKTWAQR